ncbi:hypothetical protein AURDEDRAFT_171223 [Auricularia subglabra TFB-10046 SS5]|uniref:F-box domain-containing protein n=1 Tax=Auricularia subglabra (strain TFB-10046 / SS5) TaxID=717982 RepID=J0LJ87_AURST|nr:hypothetical protein AURDEDRAFT_171223 [Auricularia subglabra TFB-10046 SS5]
MSVGDAHEMLRTALTRYFNVLASNAIEADKIETTVDRLTRASRSILCELVNDWHQDHSHLRWIPDEVVSRCFALLPFRDRLTASRVSRGWRAIALAHPAIWSDLDLRGGFANKTALLAMALDCARHHPVDLRSCSWPVGRGDVDDILATHMHHIRSLDIPGSSCRTALCSRAPLLQHLRVIQGHLRMGKDFLGGQVGRLKTLDLCYVSFPPACPALSTVTTLCLYGPFNAESAPTFRHLFRLFPTLQSLSLCHLHLRDSQFLPDGPAPNSLRRLVLESEHTGFDVSERYARWHSLNLSGVEIRQFTGPPQHIAQLVSGATELTIRHEYSVWEWNSIIAVGPESLRRALDFHDVAYDARRFAETVLRVCTALSDVRTVDISATALSDFVPVLGALPKLAHLAVNVKPEANEADVREVRWDNLSSLARLPPLCPELQSIVIDVVCCTPSALDARALILQLEAIQPATLSEITVKGFSSDTVLGMEILQLENFRVAFEVTAASVGD